MEEIGREMSDFGQRYGTKPLLIRNTPDQKCADRISSLAQSLLNILVNELYQHTDFFRNAPKFQFFL